jgi:hypothetical protein
MAAELNKLPVDSKTLSVIHQALQLASNSERRQRESLSPGSIQIALAEKLADTGKDFAHTKLPSAPPKVFFRKAIKNIRNIPQVKVSLSPSRGYKVTSDTIEHHRSIRPGKRRLKRSMSRFNADLR